MIRTVNPGGIAPPASHYHHAFLASEISELLTVSGQLGELADSTCPSGFDEQAKVAWDNVEAILLASELDIRNIIKVTSYIVGEENIPRYVELHKQIVGEHMPPWTLIVVPALGSPQYLEIDILAARFSSQL